LAICSASRLSRRATSDNLCCSLVLAILRFAKDRYVPSKIRSDVSRTVFHHAKQNRPDVSPLE
jgi:hypothetical protein